MSRRGMADVAHARRANPDPPDSYHLALYCSGWPSYRKTFRTAASMTEGVRFLCTWGLSQP
jgi:phage terminase small subunit